MKKAKIKGMCCDGCAEEVKHIFKNLYGVSNVIVSREEETVEYEGFISKRVIEEALKGTSYSLIEIEKVNN